METTINELLKKNDRKIQALYLKLVEDMSQKDIATKLDVSEKTAGQWFKPYQEAFESIEEREKLLNLIIRFMYKKEFAKIQNAAITQKRKFTTNESKEILWITEQIERFK